MEKYIDKIIDATRIALEMAIAAATDVKTSEGLLHELLYPALAQYSTALQGKAAEILRPHRQGSSHHIQPLFHRDRAESSGRTRKEKASTAIKRFLQEETRRRGRHHKSRGFQYEGSSLMLSTSRQKPTWIGTLAQTQWTAWKHIIK